MASLIVAGRRPVGKLSVLIGDWRSQGGDKVRSEFEQSLAAV